MSVARENREKSAGRRRVYRIQRRLPRRRFMALDERFEYGRTRRGARARDKYFRENVNGESARSNLWRRRRDS